MRLDLPREPEVAERRKVDIAPEAATRAPEAPVSPVTRRIDWLLEMARNHAVRSSEQRPSHRRERSPKRDREPSVERAREPEQRPRRTRAGVAEEIRGLRLRPEEQKLIAEAGRFRVLAVDDIARSIYGGDERALQSDLRFLEEKGVLTVASVAARNDGLRLISRRIDAVSLTGHGEHLAREVGAFPLEQKLYHGMVKPREIEHDTQIYRAYLKEAETIERAGGRNLRVELDFEMKAKVYRAIHEARKAGPDRDLAEIRREAAERFDLPYIQNRIEIPDARIHYEMGPEMDQGARAAFSDIEVVTAAYRPGHLRAKTQAGFRMYASASDHGRLAKVEDEHHLLDWVMEL
ncbi:MAG: hypothetical protein ACLGXA_12085 [Acidobacteriota bacterium]